MSCAHPAIVGGCRSSPQYCTRGSESGLNSRGLRGSEAFRAARSRRIWERASGMLATEIFTAHVDAPRRGAASKPPLEHINRLDQLGREGCELRKFRSAHSRSAGLVTPSGPHSSTWV